MVSGTWQHTNSAPTFTLSGAADAISGLKDSGSDERYRYYFGTDANGTPDTGTDSTSVSPGTQSDGTYYLRVQTQDNAGNWSDAATLFTFKYDGSAPTVTNFEVTWENEAPTGSCLKGKLWAAAECADTGGSSLASVEIKLDSGSYETMPAKSGGDPEDYEMEYTVDSTWENGTYTITVKVTDGAGGSAELESDPFTVNKNEISGIIAFDDFTTTTVSRNVTFVINGSVVRGPIAVPFILGTGSYVLTDVPDVITSISAKTAWHLRRKASGIALASDGQYIQDFTGDLTAGWTLRGGDLNGDNAINALDYSLLRGAWGSNLLGDINGDGTTNNADYLILKRSWYKVGDQP